MAFEIAMYDDIFISSVYTKDNYTYAVIQNKNGVKKTYKNQVLYEISVSIPVNKLTSYWLNGCVSIENIEKAIKLKQFQQTPDSKVLWHQDRKLYHIRRIAYLAVHGWNDAIDIDVGVPSLGCYVPHIVVDGNHRLAAAIYRGDEYIDAAISGSISYAEELLDMELEKYYD